MSRWEFEIWNIHLFIEDREGGGAENISSLKIKYFKKKIKKHQPLVRSLLPACYWVIGFWLRGDNRSREREWTKRDERECRERNQKMGGTNTFIYSGNYVILRCMKNLISIILLCMPCAFCMHIQKILLMSFLSISKKNSHYLFSTNVDTKSKLLFRIWKGTWKQTEREKIGGTVEATKKLWEEDDMQLLPNPNKWGS